MKRKSNLMRYLIVLFVLVTTVQGAHSDDLGHRPTGIRSYVKIGKVLEVTSLKERVIGNVIVDFSVTPDANPMSSFILTGKVVNTNSGTGMEFIPIFYGSKLHLPRMAALTNVDGEFRFRVQVVEKPDGGVGRWLYTADINESAVYLDGKFNEKARMVSSETNVYSLADFLKTFPLEARALVLPSLDSITEVKLGRLMNNGRELDAEKFKQLLGTAHLLSDAEAEDKKKNWAFAPWYMGSFVTKEGSYLFTLNLGGLGQIESPDNNQAMFTFTP